MVPTASRRLHPLGNLLSAAVLGAMPVKRPEPTAVARRIVRATHLPDKVGWIDTLESDGVEPGDDTGETEAFDATPALDKATVRAGDVMLVARGARMRVAVAGHGVEGAVASANLMLLRPQPDVLLGAALAWWLVSPDGEAALAHANRGSALLPSLSVRDVLGLEMPVPPLAVQHQLAELLEAWSATARAERRASEARAQLAFATACRAFRNEEAR
jgi:hypothetical protein